jgi:hypothetical protein
MFVIFGHVCAFAFICVHMRVCMCVRACACVSVYACGCLFMCVFVCESLLNFCHIIMCVFLYVFV